MSKLTALDKALLGFSGNLGTTRRDAALDRFVIRGLITRTEPRVPFGYMDYRFTDEGRDEQRRVLLDHAEEVVAAADTCKRRLENRCMCWACSSRGSLVYYEPFLRVGAERGAEWVEKLGAIIRRDDEL